jgi:transcriptional regulator with XRE-family HTH domain
MPILRKSSKNMPARKQPDDSTYAGRFAIRLRSQREKSGLTVEEVAAQIGVSVNAVYYWENGERQPKISDLPTIAEVLGTKRVLDILPKE